MRVRLIAVFALSLLATGTAFPVLAQVAELPAPGSGRAAYAPFEPLVGRIWRGTGTGPQAVEDIQRWDWAIGGHAVRVVHSVAGGAYAGETLIFRDRDSGAYAFHYFTTGGFHTSGIMRPTGPGAFEAEETVHGLDGYTVLRSTMTMGPDGVYRTRTSREVDGIWVEQGGFDYREDASATPVMPALSAAPARETPASAGPLDLTRRILRHVEETGQDVAAYVRIRNGDPVDDELVAVSCTCAQRVELHRIDRSGERPAMLEDAAWAVPGRDQVDVRPGSPLHFMLIGYDPAAARDGKVTLTLTFREGGTVQADFALTDDSAAAWAAFD